MSQSISRRSFLKCAGSGAVSLAAALLTGVSAARRSSRVLQANLPCWTAKLPWSCWAMPLRRKWAMCWCTSRWKTSPHPPCRWAQAICRAVRCARLGELYSMGTGVTAVCDGKPVRCGSFAAPLYGENAADASVFTLNLTAGRGALLHCFCAVPDNWQTLELTYHPDFAAGRSVTFYAQPQHGPRRAGRGAHLSCRGWQRGGSVTPSVSHMLDSSRRSP